MITAEYSTGMIRASLTAVPKRLPVLWGKALVYGLVTAALMMSTAHGAVRIKSDPGGQIGPYLENLVALRGSGERVIIDGPCLSACTIVFLGGKEIQILYVGRAHTRGDSIIFVPQDRIAGKLVVIPGVGNKAGGIGLPALRTVRTTYPPSAAAATSTGTVTRWTSAC